jgi:hypothetical protein
MARDVMGVQNVPEIRTISESLENQSMELTRGGLVNAEQECIGADVPEKGHEVKGFQKLYHSDAFYTKAAACYIYKKLKSTTA